MSDPGPGHDLPVASAPKSKAAYHALGRATAEVNKTGALPVPMHLRNAPTSLLKEMGAGVDYKDPHQHKNGYVVQQYLPDEIQKKCFYEPVDWGNEKTIAERLKWWRSQKG